MTLKGDRNINTSEELNKTRALKFDHLLLWWGSSLSDSEARVDIDIRDA